MSEIWVPQYLNFTVSNKSKQSIDADYWNALWNAVIAQADNNTHGVQYLMENLVTGVKGDAEAEYRHGDVNITKENIGLGNVQNTLDIEKYVAHALAADGITPVGFNTLITQIISEFNERYDFEEKMNDGTPTPVKYVVTVRAVADGVVSSVGGTVTGTGTYTENTSVTLNAVAKSGYLFTGWSTDQRGSNIVSEDASYTFTVTDDTILYAMFDTYTPPTPTPTTYTVGVYGVGHGSVSGGGVYEEGTTIVIRATPDSGYHFKQWRVAAPGGQVASYGATFPWTVDGDINFYAIFEEDVAPTTYTVEVYSLGNGTVSGGGTYTEGSTATITAIPDSGYHFVRWDIGTPNSQQHSYNATTTITVNSSWKFFARFEEDTEPTYTHTVNVYGTGTYGTVSGGGSFNVGDTVTLSATPNSGYEFRCWRVGSAGTGQIISNDASYSFTINSSMNTPLNIYAEFTEPTYTHTVNVYGTGTYGTVSGGGSFNVGDTVTLSATPNSGYEFRCWRVGSAGTGQIISNDASYSFTINSSMNTPLNIYAEFTEA